MARLFRPGAGQIKLTRTRPDLVGTARPEFMPPTSSFKIMPPTMQIVSRLIIQSNIRLGRVGDRVQSMRDIE